MEEMGLPELTSEQMAELCEIAEKAAREHILSEVPSNKISSLDITIDTEGTRPVTVSVDLAITLSQQLRDCDVERLGKEATKEAFASIERYLRTITCKSTE